MSLDKLNHKDMRIASILMMSFLLAVGGSWGQSATAPETDREKIDNQITPDNILIDPDGIIVARDLRGPELDRCLSEFFD